MRVGDVASSICLALQSGDWMCENCRAHNFASRAACFKCSSKP